MSQRIGNVVLVLAMLACAAAPAGALAGPGRYEVGVTSLTFTKPSETTGAPRPLDTVIWYPAGIGTGTAEALGLRDADVYPARFPLIIFSHGACGRPIEASYLTKALASRGFVVAAPAHLGNTADNPNCGANFADSLVNRVPDARFVIDSMLAEIADPSSRFADRLRPDAIGMSGLSFGGYTTLSAAQREPRLRAAVAMVPGGVEVLAINDITIPTMVIGGERDLIVGFAESERAYQRLAGPRFLVELLKANHLAVTDSCFPLCLPGELPEETAHRLVLRYVLPFFRHYLTEGRTRGAGLVRPLPFSVLQAEPNRTPPPTP